MTNVLIFLILVLLGVPLGAGLAVFLRWLSQQKKGLRSQQNVANAWAGLAGLVLFNLIMAALNAFQRHPYAAQRNVVEAAIFSAMLFGAWAEARRFQHRH